MQVRAIQDGFFKGSRIRAGKVFNIPKGTKLGKWMEEISLSQTGASPEKEPETFSEVNAIEKDSPKEEAAKKALASKAPSK